MTKKLNVSELLSSKLWLRRTLSALSALLLLSGLALVGYPLASNLWQGRLQDRLGKQLASPQLQQAYRDRKVGTGDSLTRIKIPDIGVDVVVVEGTTPSALRAGAGHYANTSLPCDVGNVAIAGHRTTFGKPFANLDRLKPGATIELDTPVGGCVYQVSKDPLVVSPNDLSVLDASTDRTLTLTTCHPKGSAAQRLVIKATWSKDLTSA
ncbi:MAG TPA: class E sortase [Acidimicrobiales bacterium]|nr:class E sortase [Acidimicrobiales bacterium]